MADPWRVHKYSVSMKDLGDVVTLDLPQGAKVLSVVNQKETLCIYARVNVNHVPRVRHFRLCGTGHPLGEDDDHSLRFIGTVLFMGGDFVLHVFEVEGRPHD